MDRFITKSAPADEVERVPLPADCAEKLMSLGKSDALMATLSEAYTYTKTVVSPTPLLISGPAHTKASLKEKMSADADGSVTASGTLMDLNLEVDAVTTLDVARIQWLMTHHADARAFKDAIGLITVNWDTADANGSSLQRLDKDAEIQALCLLIFWTKAQAFIDAAADLVFKYVHGGQGSDSKAYSLKLINQEETKRKVRNNNHRCGIHSIASHIPPGRGRCRWVVEFGGTLCWAMGMHLWVVSYSGVRSEWPS